MASRPGPRAVLWERVGRALRVKRVNFVYSINELRLVTPRPDLSLFMGLS